MTVKGYGMTGRLIVPRLSVRELYLAAKYGPGRLGRLGASAARFLSALGLDRFDGTEGEFREELARRLLEELKLGEALSLASKVGSVTPVLLSAAAGALGVMISKSSARNLLRILADLGLVTRLRTWALYTPSAEDRLLAIVASKGEVTVRELEEFVEGDVRDLLVKLWMAGRVEIEGNLKGPVPGPLNLPKELIAKWGMVIPEEVVVKEGLADSPRLERFVDRETGKVVYSVLVREDDRVRLVVRKG